MLKRIRTDQWVLGMHLQAFCSAWIDGSKGVGSYCKTHCGLWRHELGRFTALLFLPIAWRLAAKMPGNTSRSAPPPPRKILQELPGRFDRRTCVVNYSVAGAGRAADPGGKRIATSGCACFNGRRDGPRPSHLPPFQGWRSVHVARGADGPLHRLGRRSKLSCRDC